MRRNTPGAIALGKKLLIQRTYRNLTMREVGRRVGAPAATISQIEHGTRALKEHRIPAWAAALEMPERKLRALWKECDSYEAPPIIRRSRTTIPKTRFQELVDSLTATERQRVLGYIEAVLEERKETKQKHSCGT